MSSRDALVAERLASIDSTIERRNALLRQLYVLIQSHKTQSMLAADLSPSEEPGFALFSDKFNLKNNPNTAFISNLSDRELYAAVASNGIEADQQPSSPTPITVTHAPSSVDIPIESGSSTVPNDVPVDAEMVDATIPTSEKTPVSPSSVPVMDTNSTLGPVSEPPTTSDVQVKVEPSQADSLINGADTPMDVDVKPDAAETLIPKEDEKSPTEPPSATPAQLQLQPVTNLPTNSSGSSPYGFVPTPTSALPEADSIKTATEITLPSRPDPPKYNSNYTLPPLSMLSAEFTRKGAARSAKQQKKKEKERERQALANGMPAEAVKKEKGEEFTPLGLNRWGAIIRSNPVYTRVSTATKTLSTKDWNIAMMELSVVKALERIDELKDGKWSFRQPKKQRGVGGLMKTHWDYLMDEMKWMRIDFREERKWKLSVAHMLAHSVIEWHNAGTAEERLNRGICVLWKRPPVTETAETERTEETTERKDSFAQSKSNSLVLLNYGSDEDDEDDEAEPEKEETGRETAAEMIEASLAKQDESQPPSAFQVKQEDIEQPVQGDDESMVVDQALLESSTPAPQEPSTSVLNPDSTNPLLAVASDPASVEEETPASNTPKAGTAEAAAYGVIRENVVYSDDLKLFFDDSDISSALAGFDELSLEPTIADVFADLQPYTMLDPPPPAETEKKKGDKKSDKIDPYKRAEDTTFSKLTPVVPMMHFKPTLLGPLQPAKRWRNGKWVNFDDAPISVDFDKSAIKLPPDISSDLFESHGVRHPPQTVPLHPSTRRVEYYWSPADDALLKSIVDKYYANWALIAECFNSMRPSVRNDRRTAYDCEQHWKAQFNTEKPPATPAPEMSPAASPSPALVTRGTKRAASAVSVPPSTVVGVSGESQKRRRHLTMAEFLRKAERKKKDAAAKALASNARKPAGLHETHEKYATMRPLTPAELGVLKREREEINKQAELQRRSQLLGQRMANMPVQLQQTQLSALARGQPIPQIRNSQVNISQQQRMTTPVATQTVAAVANRNVPGPLNAQQAQRVMQAMANHQQGLPVQPGQAHAFVQQQAAQQVVNGTGNHLSPPQVPRDATASPAISAAATAASPPRNSTTPSNSSPRPLSAQAGAVPGTPMANRPTSIAGVPYYPIQSMQGAPQYTEHYMRMMQHAQQQHQLVQAAQAHVQAQAQQHQQQQQQQQQQQSG